MSASTDDLRADLLEAREVIALEKALELLDPNNET